MRNFLRPAGHDAAVDHSFEVMKVLFGLVSRTAHQAAKGSHRLGILLRELSGVQNDVAESVSASQKIQEMISSSSAASQQAQTMGQQAMKNLDQAAIAVKSSSESSEIFVKKLRETLTRVDIILNQVPRIAKVSEVVDEISLQSKLLAFNAAVEASHAGELGKGFHVVAQEIKKLSDSTAQQTAEIRVVLDQVNRELAPTQKALSEILAMGGEHSQQIQVLKTNFLQMTDQITQMSVASVQISKSLASQVGIAQASYQQAQRSQKATDVMFQEVRSFSQEMQALSALTEQSYKHFEILDIDTIFHRTLRSTHRFASELEEIFETAISENKCTASDLLALEYTEIKGDLISKLGRLFNVSKVPSSGFLPAKFMTRYDAVVDERITEVGDAILASDPELIFTLSIDLNAYTPSHNSRCIQDWTGDPAKDLVNNRLKRFFQDNGGLLRAARMGLGESANLPAMLTSKDLQRLGSRTKQPSGPKPYLVQSYPRDTGAIVTCVSVPIYVQGELWGAAVLGWQQA